MKSLIWYAPSCSGGLCDRLLGMVTSYCIAKQLRRRFLIKIDNFDMPNLCPINPKYDYRLYNVPYTGYIENNIEQQKLYSDVQWIDKWSEVENVLIWSNQNLFRYFCKNRPEIDYRKYLLEGFSYLFTELLYLEPLSYVKTGDCIGVHIRTKDKQMKSPELRSQEKPYITEVLQKCKRSLSERGVEFSKLFISSDCSLSYEIAEELFRDKEILYNRGEIVHSGDVTETEGLKKVFRDLLSLSMCGSVYMGWHSNFSKVSALINPEREFYVYEYPGVPEVVRCDVLEIADYFSNPWWR
jgi:hypothetical protein